MFKSLRNKIQSLSETQQNILTVILVLFNLGIIIFWISFWFKLSKPAPAVVQKPTQVGEIPEQLRPGEIGEVVAGEKPLIELPITIFNTSGVIKEIQKDRLIILGEGTNFSDQKARELTLLFSESTTTFDGKELYQGFAGLKYLKVGDLITLQATENIRGKTQFFVDRVNKL